MYDRIVSVLTDEELEGFSNALYREQRRRLNLCLKQGNFEPLTEAELRFTKSGEKIKAIKQYRQRTGCSLTYARDVIDWHYNE